MKCSRCPLKGKNDLVSKCKRRKCNKSSVTYVGNYAYRSLRNMQNAAFLFNY